MIQNQEVAMATTNLRTPSFSVLTNRIRLQRGLAFGVIIIAALLAFEVFNYSTTDFALGDLLGDLSFAGIRWATILAIAFCGIDFAGIARLFTPESGSNEPTEVWYLFGAWLLAATMNAMLTWWGVSIAVLSHQTLGSTVIERTTLLRVVPIFVAVMVWLIRVLIIGTFSMAGDRIFSQEEKHAGTNLQSRGLSLRGPGNRNLPAAQPLSAASRNNPVPIANFKPAPKTNNQQEVNGYGRPEPTYHPVSMNASNTNGNNHPRR
jgi:hypothetical protein